MKQVIVFRKDLQCRKGKVAAQVAHASVGVVSGVLLECDDDWKRNQIEDWINQGMPKIVVGCESEDELMQLQEQARINYVMSYLVKDAGKTEFKEPTFTALAIGPDQDEKIDKITGHLKLL